MDQSIFAHRVIQPAVVMLRQMDDESVLLNLDTGRYYGLDDVGTHLYGLIVAAPTLDAAFDAAQREYDVSADALRDDISTLVTRLVEEGLLEIRDAEEPAG